MKILYRILLTISFALANPLHADTTADALFIADQHMLANRARERFEDLNRNMLTSLRDSLNDLGVEIIDPERFVSELIGDFPERVLGEIHAAVTASALRKLTPDELSKLSVFYRSEQGQALINEGLMIPNPNENLEFFSDEAGKQIASKVGNLLVGMEDMSKRNFALAANLFAPNRLADIAEINGILQFKSEADRRIIIDYLRKTR